MKDLSLVSRAGLFLCFLLVGAVASARQEIFDPEKLGRSEYCGLCHTDIYQQWNASTHHFSSFNNPVYRKTIVEKVGLENSDTLEFCAGCHDPLIMVTGEFDNINVRSWEANAGITCLSCHRMKNLGKKNGEYTIDEPILHPFALAEENYLQKAHELLLDLSPWLHRNTMSDKEYETSEYCATCHTLEVPARINKHTDIILLNEYESWRNSHYAHDENGATGEQRCQDCHMPLVASDDPAAKQGMVRSHSFAASNTLIPLINRDFDHLEAVKRFLSENKIVLTLSGLRDSSEQSFSPASDFRLSHQGQLEMSIAVHNAGVGHDFPAGTLDSNEAWISAYGQDAHNQLAFNVGVIDSSEQLPQDVVRFGAIFVDKQNQITNRATTTTQAVKEVNKVTIAPGETREFTLKIAMKSGWP